MDFIFTSGFDWMMAAFMLICAILLVLPVGETILDYLTPKDNFNNKQVFKGETRKKYKKALVVFCLVMCVIEASAALIVPIWPIYSMIYLLFILADLLAFGAYGKKLNQQQ